MTQQTNDEWIALWKEQFKVNDCSELDLKLQELQINQTDLQNMQMNLFQTTVESLQTMMNSREVLMQQLAKEREQIDLKVAKIKQDMAWQNV